MPEPLKSPVVEPVSPPLKLSVPVLACTAPSLSNGTPTVVVPVPALLTKVPVLALCTRDSPPALEIPGRALPVGVEGAGVLDLRRFLHQDGAAIAAPGGAGAGVDLERAPVRKVDVVGGGVDRERRPLAISVLPVPVCSPPLHVKVPETVSVPVPPSVPPDWVRVAVPAELKLASRRDALPPR